MALIDSVKLTRFHTTTRMVADEGGHAHPVDTDLASVGSMLTIRDSDGAEGYCLLLGGDYLREQVMEAYIRPIVLGKDSMRREQVWNELYLAQRGAYGHLHDRALSFVEQAMWDLAGRKTDQPVWKMTGGLRSSIAAYASTMCGDEIDGGLSSPQDYANFAVALVQRGYRAIKLHTWMPPVSFAPDVDRDIAACAAVRDAVGPDVALMLDPHHWYSRGEALKLAKAIGELNYLWMEEPMDEYSMSSYKWLVNQVGVLVAGPESVEGKFRSRAEWAASGAVDILRIGTGSAGGITPALKVCALAESFGMDCEVHGGGAGALAVIAASANSRWYERGLLHPHVDYDVPPPHLVSIVDPMDSQGMVVFSNAPGLGEAFDFDYIATNTIS